MTTSTDGKPIRVAIVCDYPEERWPSMDLVAEMICLHLDKEHQGTVAATRFVPSYRRRFTRLPILGSKGFFKNADRLVNRHLDYRKALRTLVQENKFDLYHIVDHSYAQLVHELPEGKSIVTCHDLDTFRCLLDPSKEPRPRWFLAITAFILNGLKKASAIACDSQATQAAIEAAAISTADRLRVIYLGTHPECSPKADPAADLEAERLLGPIRDPSCPHLLHVGSNIARKRIDVLLDVFAGVRRTYPQARLIKVGGALPPDLAQRASALGVDQAIVTLPFFDPTSAKDRATLAAVYRRASLVLQPSEAEGFGLPMAEALACGVPLLASDIAVLREVGGGGAVYRPVGDVEGWIDAACSILRERFESSPALLERRRVGFEQAATYSWSAHVVKLVGIYQQLVTGSGSQLGNQSLLS